jgi:hypothetical protein
LNSNLLRANDLETVPVRDGLVVIGDSEARIDPFLNVIESVFNGVGILIGKSLASFTGPDTMRGAFDDNELHIGRLILSRSVSE